MALTPAMVRMFSPFMSAVPASSFQSSARLNTKATPLDNATKTSDDTTSKADPTPHFWNSDTNASGDSASGGDTSKSSSMKSGDTSSGTKTDDTTSRTGDTTSGGDTSRRGSTASHSGDPTIPSPRGASQSGDSSFRAGSGDSSSRSGETYTRKGSGATTSRGEDTSSGTDDISVSTQSGENRDDNSRGITSRIGDAARSVDSWRRNNTSASSWNPFSESDTDFSDFFRNPFGMFSSNNYGSHQQHAMRNFPKVDIVEEGESLKIFADLPGIEKQDIKVHLDASNNLRISGKRECEIEEEDDDRHYRRYERSCGRFSRNIRMPENVDKQSIDASFHNGVLMIQLKKTAAEDQRGSTIEIK